MANKAVVKDLIRTLEECAPLSLQESYDNSGLLAGNSLQEVTSVLLCIDVTEKIIDEAIQKGVNLIISHHPFIFSGLKKINGSNETERILIKAIKNDICIYACHTNIDNAWGGVNFRIAEKLGLIKPKVLLPMLNQLFKLVTFVPLNYAEKVRTAMFAAGAGHIGNYDSCSFNTEGEGSFRGNENSNPFVGESGNLHFEEEIRIETIVAKQNKNQVVKALIQTHPYEEVAFDIYPLENTMDYAGSGIIGMLNSPMDETSFLTNLKKVFGTPILKHSGLTNRLISKVAVCGGSGSFLIGEAVRQQADVFITGDLKYHQFFEPEGKLLLVDVGHFESEQFTKNIFYDILIKNFPNIALYFSEINTNPINYF